MSIIFPLSPAINPSMVGAIKTAMEITSAVVELRHLVEMNSDRQAVASRDRKAARNVVNCACRKFSGARPPVGRTNCMDVRKLSHPIVVSTSRIKISEQTRNIAASRTRDAHSFATTNLPRPYLALRKISSAPLWYSAAKFGAVIMAPTATKINARSIKLISTSYGSPFANVNGCLRDFAFNCSA